MKISKSEIAERERKLKKWNRTRVVLSVVLILSLAIPMIKPVGLPISITKEVKWVYDFVKNMKVGDLVLIFSSGTSGDYPETAPGTTAIIKHVWERGGRVAIISVAGPDWFAWVPSFNDALKLFHDKKYSVDYVYIGYIAGGEVALSNFAKNIPAIVSVDYEGKLLSGMPIMKDVKTIRDFKAVFSTKDTTLKSGSLLHVPYGVPVIMIGAYRSLAVDMQAIQSDIISGCMDGTRAATEYELLSGYYGEGLKSQDPLSVASLFELGLIFLGTGSLLVSKYGQRISKKVTKG